MFLAFLCCSTLGRFCRLDRLQFSMKTLTAFASILALGLTGCISNMGYTRFGKQGLFGYSDQSIQPGVFSVTFRGGMATTPDDALFLTLLRAAELTIQSGHRYFAIASEADAGRNTAFSMTMPQTANVYAAGNTANVFIGPRTTIASQNRLPGWSLIVRVLSKPIPPYFDAAFLVRQAQAKGIKLELATLARR